MTDLLLGYCCSL